MSGIRIIIYYGPLKIVILFVFTSKLIVAGYWFIVLRNSIRPHVLFATP